MTPSRRLPGVLALHGGDCPRCHEPIRPGSDRVVFVKRRAIHVRCHNGQDDR